MTGFTEEERVYLSLKNLFEGFGYKKYRMRKFEEYSLYAENKNFLKSSDIITFSDRGGKLLALKPDVTLSIVKNTDLSRGTHKLYYRESVYRTDGGNMFREISQIGLEYLGGVDLYAQLEVLALAAESLNAAGGEYVIDLSHMGVIEGVMESCSLTCCPAEIAECIKAKNLHDLPQVCSAHGMDGESAAKLCNLLSAEDRLDALRRLFPDKKCLAAADELESLISALKKSGAYGAFNVDFSVINDAKYYNGIVFQGYLSGVPRSVLTGGRYDNLVKKFNSAAGGIGFALYPDELDYYRKKGAGYDADILLLYDENSDPASVLKAVKKLASGGKTVRAATQAAGIKYEKIVKVDEV